MCNEWAKPNLPSRRPQAWNTHCETIKTNQRIKINFKFTGFECLLTSLAWLTRMVHTLGKSTKQKMKSKMQTHSSKTYIQQLNCFPQASFPGPQVKYFQVSRDRELRRALRNPTQRAFSFFCFFCFFSFFVFFVFPDLTSSSCRDAGVLIRQWSRAYQASSNTDPRRHDALHYFVNCGCKNYLRN